MTMPDAEYAGIDDKVLLELIELAGFLETEVEAARFPEYRFRRYSDALDKLIHDEVIALGCDPEDLAAMQRAADALSLIHI